MQRAILIQVAQALVVVFAAVSLAFVLVRMSGDPTTILLPPDAPIEQREDVRSRLGLDRPLGVQYGDYLISAAQGDFGESYFEDREVSEIILRHLRLTATLAVSSFLLGAGLAVPLGTLAALHKGRLLDRVVDGFNLVGLSMPSFWSAILLLQLFAFQLGWFPNFGSGTFAHLVLPTVNLAFYLFPRIAKLTRSAMLDVLPMSYVEAAEARALPRWRIISRHIIPNGISPVVTLLGLELGALFGGAVLTETVFSWPGIGWLTVRAITRRDFPVVQGIIAYVAVIFVVITLVLGLLNRWINPRLREAA